MRFFSDSPTRNLVATGLVGLALLVAGCSKTEPGATPTPPVAEPSSAVEAGVRNGPRIDTLAISPIAAARALAAFRISCPDLVRRSDVSGLTRSEDWSTPCAASGGWAEADAKAFFTTHFEAAVIGDGEAFATGYYEPEILGSRERRPGYEVPIYAKPVDLLDADPATGEAGRGRVDEHGDYVLYFDRTEIEEGALAGRGLEIAWAADPVDLFFLQIQGSGRLRLPDGSIMRIGYAGQNGREYVTIGRLMRERGILERPITMQAIVDWLKAHPEEGRGLMRENRSYVFFRELTGPGPLGALGRPVTPEVSVAADPKFVPLGAPVFLHDMDNARADGLWVAQDTGGAIKGANRLDTFWGAGTAAREIAGGMSASGRAYVLVPKGTVHRLRTDGASPQR